MRRSAPPGWRPWPEGRTGPQPGRSCSKLRKLRSYAFSRLVTWYQGLAEYLDMSLGDLLEGIALHALENKAPFKGRTLEKIADLKRVYGHDLTAEDSHLLRER